MRRILLRASMGLVTLALLAAPVAAIAGEKAVCPVCKTKEGSDTPEEVKTWRTHEGVRYGFCSEKCAEEFDAEPAAFLAPSLPRPAPALAVADMAGKALDWKSLEGKVVLLDFWATWCAPCRKSMPELQALHDRYASRGFSVLGVSIDDKKPVPKVKKFVASKKIRYPIAIDSEKDPSWERFGVKAVPAAFLVDRSGNIVAQWTGVVNVRELEEKLAVLLQAN